MGFIPWYTLLVDLISQYKIRREGHDDLLILKSLTIIDQASGWFEIIQYKDKHAVTISNLVEKTCLCRYPRPTIIMYDHGNEFLGHAFENDLIKNEYRIKSKSSAADNTQNNSILQSIHQVIEQLEFMFDLQNNHLLLSGPTGPY